MPSYCFSAGHGFDAVSHSVTYYGLVRRVDTTKELFKFHSNIKEKSVLFYNDILLSKNA